MKIRIYIYESRNRKVNCPARWPDFSACYSFL